MSARPFLVPALTVLAACGNTPECRGWAPASHLRVELVPGAGGAFRPGVHQVSCHGSDVLLGPRDRKQDPRHAACLFEIGPDGRVVDVVGRPHCDFAARVEGRRDPTAGFELSDFAVETLDVQVWRHDPDPRGPVVVDEVVRPVWTWTEPAGEGCGWTGVATVRVQLR